MFYDDSCRKPTFAGGSHMVFEQAVIIDASCQGRAASTEGFNVERVRCVYGTRLRSSNRIGCALFQH